MTKFIKLFSVQEYRRQIEDITETLSTPEVTRDLIQEQGEYLSSLLGRIIEAKFVVSQAKTRLENLG